jgi:hypothetical protein
MILLGWLVCSLGGMSGLCRPVSNGEAGPPLRQYSWPGGYEGRDCEGGWICLAEILYNLRTGGTISLLAPEPCHYGEAMFRPGGNELLFLLSQFP